MTGNKLLEVNHRNITNKQTANWSNYHPVTPNSSTLPSTNWTHLETWQRQDQRAAWIQQSGAANQTSICQLVQWKRSMKVLVKPATGQADLCRQWKPEICMPNLSKCDMITHIKTAKCIKCQKITEVQCFGTVSWRKEWCPADKNPAPINLE